MAAEAVCKEGVKSNKPWVMAVNMQLEECLPPAAADDGLEHVAFYERVSEGRYLSAFGGEKSPGIQKTKKKCNQSSNMFVIELTADLRSHRF